MVGTQGFDDIVDLFGHSSTVGSAAGDHPRAARLDQLQVHGLRAVRDIDEDAELVHPPQQRAPALIDAVVVIGRLPPCVAASALSEKALNPLSVANWMLRRPSR
jgi:hypothetical protein